MVIFVFAYDESTSNDGKDDSMSRRWKSVSDGEDRLGEYVRSTE